MNNRKLVTETATVISTEMYRKLWPVLISWPFNHFANVYEQSGSLLFDRRQYAPRIYSLAYSQQISHYSALLQNISIETRTKNVCLFVGSVWPFRSQHLSYTFHQQNISNSDNVLDVNLIIFCLCLTRLITNQNINTWHSDLQLYSFAAPVHLPFFPYNVTSSII